MFQKPFKVKSNTQLKGSERKKLRVEIQKNYPELTDDDLQQLLPAKDPITAMKIFTYNSQQVLVYSNPSIPLVFEVEKIMYPTVYLLWKFPNLLYTYTTWEPVVSKLMNGADLMLPGVVVKLPFTIKSFGKIEKGEKVAVNTTENKAPIAVGKTALSSLDMYMSAKRGKGVQVLHTIGDHLWFTNERPVVPQLGPPPSLEKATADEREGNVDMIISEKDGTVGPSGDDAQCEEYDEEQSGSEKEDADNNSSENEEAEIDSEAYLTETLEGVQIETGMENQQCLDTEIINENPQEAMDNLMIYCFLKAWRTSAKKPTLPLLTSNFFRLHMIPACPSNCTLDVKKSSYKKLSTFLGAMAQKEIIKVKEQMKGVESITEVNLAHPEIRAFELRSDDISEEQVNTNASKTNASSNIVELYKITAHVLPIFKHFNCKKGDSLTPSTVRQHLTDYVKNNNLQDSQNPRLVQLDAVLQDAVEGVKGTPQGDASTIKLSWEELMLKCMARMSQTYYLTATGPATTTAPPKGKLEPIDIRVSMRSGNKKVTLVNNLELFGIVCQDFARKCQHGVAASTSISAVPGKKSAQVLVQGNQVEFIGKLLLNEYKIPVRYIRGLENAPPKKGAKKKAKN